MPTLHPTAQTRPPHLGVIPSVVSTHSICLTPRSLESLYHAASGPCHPRLPKSRGRVEDGANIAHGIQFLTARYDVLMAWMANTGHIMHRTPVINAARRVLVSPTNCRWARRCQSKRPRLVQAAALIPALTACTMPAASAAAAACFKAMLHNQWQSSHLQSCAGVVELDCTLPCTMHIADIATCIGHMRNVDGRDVLATIAWGSRQLVTSSSRSGGRSIPGRFDGLSVVVLDYYPGHTTAPRDRALTSRIDSCYNHVGDESTATCSCIRIIKRAIPCLGSKAKG
jgi:hypothetical protein